MTNSVAWPMQIGEGTEWIALLQMMVGEGVTFFFNVQPMFVHLIYTEPREQPSPSQSPWLSKCFRPQLSISPASIVSDDGEHGPKTWEVARL